MARSESARGVEAVTSVQTCRAMFGNKITGTSSTARTGESLLNLENRFGANKCRILALLLFGHHTQAGS